MNRQFEILNEICSLLFHNTPKEFDSLVYVYKFNPDECWIGARVSTVICGKKEALDWSPDILRKIRGLCKNLHQVMQDHTGGDWRKFVLRIDENKEVTTNFIYEVQSYTDPLEQADEQ